MSSNQKTEKRKRAVNSRQMTSIARKIHRAWIWKSFCRCLRTDLLLVFLLSVFSLAQREYACFGKIIFSYKRSFLLGSVSQNAAADAVSGPFRLLRTLLGRITYLVSNKKGTVLLRVPVLPIADLIFIVIGIVVLLQALAFLFSYRRDAKKIRRTLQPINEIALKADELSRISFGEDKYQQIENAISHLHPEEADLLSFGDAELQGIEAAMNNLLIRMRESNQQQARFVNDASHELRTPIAVIQGYANMLCRWGRDDEKVLDESITAIRHEADHMKYLVEQLLFLARGDSGRTVLKKESLDLVAMMQEIYEESFMIDEDHPYRYKAPEESVTILADAALLKQAVRILIDNAAKYTKKGDEILISCGVCEDQHPFIQIQDAGIGMSENDVAHMFERFYRSDEARSYQGTGLGLSIAKWIVDKHRGHFEILSRTDLGTRIRIIL